MKHALTSTALALVLAASGAAHAGCPGNAPPGGSGVGDCPGWRQVDMSPAPSTGAGVYTLRLWGDGKTLRPSVAFFLPGFGPAFSEHCDFAPQVGSVGWPGAGSPAIGPEFQGGGSAVVNGQRLVYIDFNLADVIPAGTAVFLSGHCNF
jgi:hypothetical protein